MKKEGGKNIPNNIVMTIENNLIIHSSLSIYKSPPTLANPI